MIRFNKMLHCNFFRHDGPAGLRCSKLFFSLSFGINCTRPQKKKTHKNLMLIMRDISNPT